MWWWYAGNDLDMICQVIKMLTNSAYFLNVNSTLPICEYKKVFDTTNKFIKFIRVGHPITLNSGYPLYFQWTGKLMNAFSNFDNVNFDLLLHTIIYY